jgi:hypothetical protein
VWFRPSHHNERSTQNWSILVQHTYLPASPEQLLPPFLTDFGAASFAREGWSEEGGSLFTQEEIGLLERIEVRAFSCLIEDLLGNAVVGEHATGIAMDVVVGEESVFKRTGTHIATHTGTSTGTGIDTALCLPGDPIIGLGTSGGRSSAAAAVVVVNELRLLQEKCRKVDVGQRPCFKEVADAMLNIKRSMEM